MIVVFLATCFFSPSSSELVVETSSGPIQSVAALTNDVEAFLGIPYAEPPIGDLRFAKPHPKKPWKEMYYASNLPPPCTQYSVGTHYFMADSRNMSEDCLYLNVWMPKADYGHRHPRPILFYIHPGGFGTGSSNLAVHDGSRLASRGDVVVVTINYRLGALGYLLAFIDEADGSMGIYDQIMALSWVKDNAKAFGGDPENIVLMGVSAGAWSISSFIVSPLTKNLFKRAIMQSGSSIHPFFQDDNARLFRNSEALAIAVGCSNKTSNLSSDPRSVVKCLKSIPAKEFADVEYNFLQTQPIMFVPRTNDSFLPQSVLELLRRGTAKKDIQILAGIAKDEGSSLMTILLSEYFGLYGRNRTRTVNKNLAFVIGVGAIQLLEQPRANDLVRTYVKNAKDRTEDGYSKVVADIIGDGLIACSTVFYADFMSLFSKNVYFYKFEYRSPSTPLAEWMGTTHLDEIQYVFGNPYHANFTEEETELSHHLMDRWSAFAKTGNPNIPNHFPWLPYSYRRPLYLSIDAEESIRWRPLSRCESWRKRYKAEIEAQLLESNVDQGSTEVQRSLNVC